MHEPLLSARRAQRLEPARHAARSSCSSIALATLLLLGVERMRSDVRESFSQSVCGTDLIVGARTGAVQLMLYSVFRIGGATNNIRMAEHRRDRAAPRRRLGRAALARRLAPRLSRCSAPPQRTSTHFRYGDHQPLRLAQGGRSAAT